jgi:hypothetical protein
MAAREELAQLLGELESDVCVLASELRTQSLPNYQPTPSIKAARESVSKLWIVRSQKALPASLPQAATQSVGFKSTAAGQYTAEAFSAHILYDLAAALRVPEAELPKPDPQKLSTAKGRLKEWTTNSWRIRIRDFQAETGWLSVVEAIPE